MLSTISANYIFDTIGENPQHIPQKYYDEYNTMLYASERLINDFKQKENETERLYLNKTEILYYINREYTYIEGYCDGFCYWNLDGTHISYYKRNEDGSYNLQRTTDRVTELDGIPDIYIFGNCVVLVAKGATYYFAKEHRLNYIVRRDNKYYGFSTNNKLKI